MRNITSRRASGDGQGLLESTSGQLECHLDRFERSFGSIFPKSSEFRSFFVGALSATIFPFSGRIRRPFGLRWGPTNNLTSCAKEEALLSSRF